MSKITGQLFLPFFALWAGAAGLNLLQRLLSAQEFFESRVDRCRSDKRFLILIPSRQECLDAGLQAMHAAKGSTADRLRAQFAKPSLDQVQPTGAGRDKVRHEARVVCEPGPHVLVLMRPIILKTAVTWSLARSCFENLSTNGVPRRSPVEGKPVRPERCGFRGSRRDPRVPTAVLRIIVQIVHDNMQRDIARERFVESAQELEEFLVPMSLISLADYLALQSLQSGEKCGRAVALVVMGHGPAKRLPLERQAGLRPI